MTNHFYFAGDTGYSPDFKDIGNHFNGFDVSMLPIGAYEPQWFMKHIHANPYKAAKMHTDVKSKLSLAMHWGTFMLTNEPMHQPPVYLRKAMNEQDIEDDEFKVPKQGEVIRLF